VESGNSARLRPQRSRAGAVKFPDVSSVQGKGFVRNLVNSVGDKVSTRAHAVRTGGDDSIMLEAIVLLLSLATCALILIAFWGLDLLRIQSRRQG
jgi:hypothetical protein